MQFDGVNDQLTKTLALSQPATIIAVVAPTKLHSTNSSFIGDTSGNGFVLATVTAPINGSFAIYAGGSGVLASNDILTINSLSVVSGVFNNPNSKPYKNGVVGASTNGGGAVGTANSTKFGLGGLDSGIQMFQGLISEVLVYNKALSDAERKTVESYLQAKYNTPALPA